MHNKFLTPRPLLTIAFAVAVIAAGTVWIRSLEAPPSPAGSLAFLSAAPALPIFDRAGQETDLAKEKGRLAIVHFWATWCPPCVEEIPALSKFWEGYRGRRDIALFAISVDKDWKTIEKFTAENPNNLPMYHDPGGATARRFGTGQYPETYVVNESGRVLFRVQGAVSWGDQEVARRIEQLLAS